MAAAFWTFVGFKLMKTSVNKYALINCAKALAVRYDNFKYSDQHRKEANKLLNPKTKSALGQFMTPAPICLFMASLFDDIKGDIKLLDPGCGVGSLSAAFVERALRLDVDKMELDAIDIATGWPAA